jgi:hypothetical protein
MINGRTGHVQGERPYSWVKITLAILAGIAIIVIIILLTGHHQQHHHAAYGLNYSAMMLRRFC